MNRHLVPAAVAVVVAPALLAACDASAATPTRAAPSHDTTAGELTGACVTGIYDETQHRFDAMSSFARGTRIASGDEIAEAYQLTLTDTSAQSPVTVTGFSVAFYSGSREVTSAAQTLAAPAGLQHGQSRTLTEHPWGSSSAGHGASAGPFATGQHGAVNTAATCRLVRWHG